MRFWLAPFKAYVIGVPLVVAAWMTSFQEPNPHGWDERAENTYTGVIYQIFGRIHYGYLLCLAAFLMTVLVSYFVRDRRALRAAAIYALITAFCVLWTYGAAHPPHTR